MSFAFITPASLKPFSPEAVAVITMSNSYSLNPEADFDSSSTGSDDDSAANDSEIEEEDDEDDEEEDERFQAISPNRLRSPLNADPDRLTSFTSTEQRSLISRNSRKQLSLQAALGSFRDKISSPSYSSSAGSSTFSPGTPFFFSPVQQAPSPQSTFDNDEYESEDEEELISPIPSQYNSRRSSSQTVYAVQTEAEEAPVASKVPVALPSLDQLASWRLRRQEMAGQEQEEVKEDKPLRSPTSIAARGRGLTILSRRTD